jgi:hypothetical protein
MFDKKSDAYKYVWTTFIGELQQLMQQVDTSFGLTRDAS